MSQLNVDTIEPEGASTTLTLGASGDTVTIPSGATIDASAATATGFGDDNSPAFEATVGTSQTSITSGVATKVAFNTEVFDVGSNFDHATNYRFVAPEDGKYFMYAQSYLIGAGVGTLDDVTYAFYLNGSTSAYAVFNDYRGPGGSGDSVESVTVTNTAIMDLSTSDYVEVFATISTSTSTWTIDNNKSAFFGFKMAGV